MVVTSPTSSRCLARTTHENTAPPSGLREMANVELVEVCRDENNKAVVNLHGTQLLINPI